MTNPLYDYFDENESRRLLVTNLETNLEVYCPEMPLEEKVAFMRVNLIMIRQAMEQERR